VFCPRNCTVFVGHVDTDKPLGDKEFIEKLERVVGRVLRQKKPGPKKKGN